MLHLLYIMLQMYRKYTFALIGALCLLSCNKEKAPDPISREKDPDPVVEKYHFALKDAEASAAVEVAADASGSYTWTVEAAPELTDLETSVSLDGTTVTEGVKVDSLETGGLTVTVSYAANDSFEPKVWTVTVSTQNTNVEVQAITMTLTQKSVVPDFTDVASLKALITASETEFRGFLADAVVTYVNGPRVFIEDASAGIMLYLYNSGFKAGQKLNGAVTASGTLFNNLPELVSLSAATVEDGADIPCSIVTLAELSTAEGYAKWESRRVKVEGATVEKSIVGGKNVDGMLSQADSTFATYNQASVTIGGKGDVIDLICYPTVYNGTKQLYVFGDDFIVLKSTAGIISMPEAQTLKVGEELSLGASVNSGAAITYESSDTTVVVVNENGLVMALGEGSATITATAPANGIYREASASCQVTVVPNVATEEILVNETFKTSQGAFTINNIAIAAKLADKGVWKHNPDALGGVIVGNLYVSGNSEISKTRLESPEFSLKGKNEYAILSFKHDGAYIGSDIYKVQYTTDGGATWTDIEIVGAFADDKKWELVDATVDLSAALGAEKVKFGFYLEGKEMLWELQSVVLKAK